MKKQRTARLTFVAKHELVCFVVVCPIAFLSFNSTSGDHKVYSLDLDLR
ncbi:MAG TPA: hypothetical protein VEU98_08000 [Candidatus Eremiobacteraceae bacterium]|nr:hypothetical protein [Candidatus Eremiobacteraceae bacterium]